MAFQGNAFQPNAFQAGTSDAAEEAATLVGAVQVLEVYQYRPPTSFVRVAQIVSPPVEALLPPAWKQIGTQTSLAPSSKARVFFDNQERLKDFLGAVQVVENYGEKKPFSVVQPGLALQDQAAPRVETFPAWMPRTMASAQALASTIDVIQAPAAIENFYPRDWQARASSIQLLASRTALFQLVEPAVEAFRPRGWEARAASVLPAASRATTFHIVEPPVEVFYPRHWRVALSTAVEFRGSAAIFLPVQPAVEAFVPRAWQAVASTALAAQTSAATWQPVREPEVVVVAAQPLGWIVEVQTGVELRSRAATFQLVTPPVEAFAPQARQASVNTALAAQSRAATHQLVREPETVAPPTRGWGVSVATALEAKSRAATFQVAGPAVQNFYPRAWQAATGTALNPASTAAAFQLVAEPAAPVVLVLRGIVQVLEVYQELRPTSFARAPLVRDAPPFVPPTVPVEIPDFDGGYRYHRPTPDREPERQQERRRKQEELKQTVERAFRKAFGEEEPAAELPRPVKKKELRRVAVQMLPEIRGEGIRTTLAEIMRLLEAYQAALLAARIAARKKDDEEALIVLMMTP